jgi:hypothetical protein
MQGKLLGTLGGNWVVDVIGIVYMPNRIFTGQACSSTQQIRSINDVKFGDEYHFSPAYVMKMNKQDIPLLADMIK